MPSGQRPSHKFLQLRQDSYAWTNIRQKIWLSGKSCSTLSLLLQVSDSNNSDVTAVFLTIRVTQSFPKASELEACDSKEERGLHAVMQAPYSSSDIICFFFFLFVNHSVNHHHHWHVSKHAMVLVLSTAITPCPPHISRQPTSLRCSKRGFLCQPWHLSWQENISTPQLLHPTSSLAHVSPLISFLPFLPFAMEVGHSFWNWVFGDLLSCQLPSNTFTSSTVTLSSWVHYLRLSCTIFI
jgi:hypothetical protein